MENIDKDIDDLLAAYGRLGYCALAFFVERLESSEAGQAIVRRNPNQRLYAIARPTQQEYLQRLEAVLRLTDEPERELLLLDLRALLPTIRYDWCITKHYFNGEISCRATVDLHNKLWGVWPLEPQVEDIYG